MNKSLFFCCSEEKTKRTTMIVESPFLPLPSSPNPIPRSTTGLIPCESRKFNQKWKKLPPAPPLPTYPFRRRRVVKSNTVICKDERKKYRKEKGFKCVGGAIRVPLVVNEKKRRKNISTGDLEVNDIDFDKKMNRPEWNTTLCDDSRYRLSEEENRRWKSSRERGLEQLQRISEENVLVAKIRKMKHEEKKRKEMAKRRNMLHSILENSNNECEGKDGNEQDVAKMLKGVQSKIGTIELLLNDMNLEVTGGGVQSNNSSEERNSVTNYKSKKLEDDSQESLCKSLCKRSGVSTPTQTTFHATITTTSKECQTISPNVIDREVIAQEGEKQYDDEVHYSGENSDQQETPLLEKERLEVISPRSSPCVEASHMNDSKTIVKVRTPSPRRLTVDRNFPFNCQIILRKGEVYDWTPQGDM